MARSKDARDKAFEVGVPKQVPNHEQEKPKPEQFYRPDESRRRELARQWLRVARGECANLQTGPQE